MQMAYQNPYASGVLQKNVHARIVADLPNIAAEASIRPEMIYTPLAQVCGEHEVEWVRRFKHHVAAGSAGLCLVGTDPSPDVETRMAAIAGALLRNWVRARVMTVNTLLELVEDKQTPDHTCLCIPNFMSQKVKQGGTAGWKIDNLLDALVQRQVRSLATVIYVPDMSAMVVEYGKGFKHHIETHFEVVAI